jgi:S-adenosylmethionine:tRNA ribosyltransferase-isomerase
MRLADLDYALPPELIAEEPCRPRDASRLLVLHRARGEIEHRAFRELPQLLSQQDLVVMNDTRVIPARLVGKREATGGRVEALLVREESPGVWQALVSASRRLKPGDGLVFGQGEMRARLIAGPLESGGRLLEFEPREQFRDWLERAGEVPLPPYLHSRRGEDQYQTVFAREPGSSAAPTAGLHFTEELLAELRLRAAGLVFLTLHIGPATFRPIRTEQVEAHVMHEEWFSLSPQAAAEINRARAGGKRLLAVGTSTLRALESSLDPEGRLEPRSGPTRLFILPGYRFQVVGALLTNFHLPRSTLLALVFAFAGREPTLRAYEEAIGERYGFLSFGDAMLIL